MENILMNVLDFSHACEIFDNTKKISDDDINFILKAGKKSTSSFGMKPWKFLVISNDELKTKISPLCSEEISISSSSHLVIFLAPALKHKPDGAIGMPLPCWRMAITERISFWLTWAPLIPS